VLEAVRAHRVRKVVTSSSAGIFGELKTLPIREDHPIEPDTPYGSTKLCSEKLCLAYAKLYDVEAVCLRYFNVYGPNQRFDAYGNVIPIFAFQMLRGEPLTVFGDGEQTRAFTHIADVAPAIAHSVERDGARDQIFNIGADEPHSVNALASAVGRAMGTTPTMKYLEQRHEVVHAYSDHSRAREVFGDLYRGVTLDDGMARMAAWARAHGARETPRFAAVEVERNLPPSWR
jgi:UDP-glucose 4-epimerase